MELSTNPITNIVKPDFGKLNKLFPDILVKVFFKIFSDQELIEFVLPVNKSFERLTIETIKMEKIQELINGTKSISKQIEWFIQQEKTKPLLSPIQLQKLENCRNEILIFNQSDIYASKKLLQLKLSIEKLEYPFIQKLKNLPVNVLYNIFIESIFFKTICDIAIKYSCIENIDDEEMPSNKIKFLLKQHVMACISKEKYELAENITDDVVKYIFEINDKEHIKDNIVLECFVFEEISKIYCELKKFDKAQNAIDQIDNRMDDSTYWIKDRAITYYNNLKPKESANDWCTIS